MRISKTFTGRALTLGLIVLLSGLALAQDKSAIERMDERIAGWTKAPTQSFTGLEVAFPATTEEAKLAGNNALLLVTRVTAKHDEANISSSYVVQGGKQFTLTLLAGMPITQLGTSNFFRSDKIFYLPLKWISADANVTVTAGSKFEELKVGPLPASPLPPVAADTSLEFPAKNAPPVNELLKRDFASLELDRVRVRVSSDVAQQNLAKQVRPDYPQELQTTRISGQVVLAVTIGKDGRIQSIRTISGHPLLVDPAVKAVRQWIYKPFLLNGEPVEVETTVTVNFVLG